MASRRICRGDRVSRLAIAVWALSVLAGCAGSKPVEDDGESSVSREAVAAAPGQSDESAELGDFDGFDEFNEDSDIDEPVEVFDPLSGFNRGVHHVNDWIYLWIWEPTAKGYNFVLPEFARVAINEAFINYKIPVRFANALLQLKGEKAGIELGRFLTNTTIGFAGFYDAADHWFDLPAPSPEDFGQTLAHWGLGPGFPIVIPLLGPSNLRDGVGLVADAFSHPLPYFIPIWASVSIAASDRFNYSSLHVGEYESLKNDALDPYTFFRDAYEQNREQKIEE